MDEEDRNSMGSLQNLLSPITIKTLELANRKRMARGGAGLIIIEVCAVHPSAPSIDSELCVYEDRFVPGLRKLTEIAHAAGSQIALQLHHAGRESLYLLKQKKAIAPSPIRSLVFGLTPREMTLDDIKEIIAALGTAAVRAQEAGFDAVEVHGAHGYLLTQFLSALCNQRSDEYGGSLANRARFVVEVLQEVRRRVGGDFPISLR